MPIYKLATPAHRLGGYFLDASIGIGVAALVNAISGNIIILIVLLAVLWGVAWANGTTPGKAILDMNVVNKDTQEIAGFGTMLLREIIGKAISNLVFGLGFIWILLDEKNQGWHDKLVNTVVIKKR